MSHGLSKSRIMGSRQCPKLLWVSANEPERIVFGKDVQRIFAMGHQAGRAARGLHPEGVLIGGAERGRLERGELRAALAETSDRLARTDNDLTLFEATFEHDGVLVRSDLLFREHGRIRFSEVKASTEVKKYHPEDAAIQAWVMQASGVPVEKVFLSHVDNSFVYPGGGKYAGLFRDEDITDKVRALMPLVPAWVSQAREVLDDQMPNVPVGPRCRDPHVCPLLDWCRECDGDAHVGYLPGGLKLVGQLQDGGYVRLRDVPVDRLRSDVQLRVLEATVKGRPTIDPAIRAELREIGYPRYYFDFETINFAVPIWAGTRPWEQLPRQYSCHIQEAPGRDIHHVEFLDMSGEPPMRACAEKLLGHLGNRGPVIVYHQTFEKTILKQLAARFPDLAERLNAVNARVVDLLPIVKRNYYHPDMRGSWSLKAVLPTVAPDLDYASFDEVHDGAEAQSAYDEAIDPETSSERRAKIRRGLLDYCERDTLAMVRIVERFE